MSEKYGNLGMAISHFKVGYQDTSLLKETQLTLAHGFNLYERLSTPRIDFGYALNCTTSTWARRSRVSIPGSDTAFGIDLGLMMTLHKRTPLGFQIKNLNNPQIGHGRRGTPAGWWRGSATSPTTG